MGLLRDMLGMTPMSEEERKEKLAAKKAKLEELELDERIAKKKKDIRDARGGGFF